MRGMVWSTRLTNDTTAADIERKLTPFSEERNKPHYYVMAYPTDSVSANELLFNVARHNFNSFVVKDFDLEQMTFGRMGLLLVKGFANFNEVSHYKSVLEADKGLVIPPMVRHVLISVDNFNILLNEGRSLEEYFDYLENKSVPKESSEVGDEPADAADEPESDEPAATAPAEPADAAESVEGTDDTEEKEENDE